MGVWIPILGILVGGIAVLGAFIIQAMKIKHGYPLQDDDGNFIHRGGRPEDLKLIEQLTSENSELRDRLEAIGDRVETLERIATDKPARLAAEIDALADLSKEKSE